MRQSARGQVDPFLVMDVLAAAQAAEAQGRRIVHMEIGQPAIGAPAAARAALRAALEHPLGYTTATGLPALRAGIAALCGRWYGVDLDPARVIVTTGSSGAFILAFTLLFDAGDRVAMGSPGYPSYRQILRALALVPDEIATDAAARYQPTPEQLPEGAAGLLLASPGNPSGTMLDRAALAALLAAAAARGMAVVSDEIYHGLTYGAPAMSALELTDDVVVVNSFSKFFAMTGWRIGWMVVPDALVRPAERLAQNLFICPPHASQVAALAALGAEDEARAALATYRGNRATLLDALGGRLGPIAPPDGAFYLYADVSGLTGDSRRLAADLLDRAGVAVTPGLDFDAARGHGTLRLSYAGAPADIAEGAARIRAFLDRG